MIDLGMLLSKVSAGMLDVPRAIALLQQAWTKGVTIAAFELGSLYEHGVGRAGTSGYLLAPDEAVAWPAVEVYFRHRLIAPRMRPVWTWRWC